MCLSKLVARSAVLRTVGAALLIWASASTASTQPQSGIRVFIRFASTPGASEEALVRAHGGNIKYTYHLVPAIAATLPPAAVQALRKNPNVSALEPDGVVQLFDAELDAAWGVKRIGSGLVHDSGNRGDGVRVAIIDTGIDCAHPDLNANCVGGVDFVNDDNDPMDDHGHGTHVAGTVAAEDDGTGVVGVAPRALLYGLKVLSASGTGYWSDIIAAIQWAADNGIQVTNNSYGGSANPGSTVQAAFDNSYAAGVLHVAAAGNSGNCTATGNSVGYPAAFASVIAVAATDSSDQRACFSSTGPAVELAAPGVSITSTKRGGGYVAYSGTSMASPHVAGAAALILANGVYSSADARQRLRETADDLGAAGVDSLYGYGLVDADESADGQPINQLPVVSIDKPTDGSTFDSAVPVPFQGTALDPEDGSLTSTLVWTSDRDGLLGTGGSFSAILSDGVHKVTAAATDSGGKTATASRTITIGQSTSGEVTVAAITYGTFGGKDGKKHLSVTVSVFGSQNQPFSGAGVTIRLTSSPLSWQSSGTTGSDGKVTFTLNRAPDGCYQTEVLDLVANGMTWDGTTPANSFCK